MVATTDSMGIQNGATEMTTKDPTPAASGLELPELPEPFEIEWPQLHRQGLGCGVEDRDLTDRYECAEYGWQDGVDRAADCVPEQIFTADQMHAYARQALAAQPAPGVGGDARLEELAYVPGAWRCPKCSLRLIAQTLHMQDGGMSANNQPQACANGCGPMWRVTEREDRQDAQRFANEQTDKLNALLSTRPVESVAQTTTGETNNG